MRSLSEDANPCLIESDSNLENACRSRVVTTDEIGEVAPSEKPAPTEVAGDEDITTVESVSDFGAGEKAASMSEPTVREQGAAGSEEISSDTGEARSETSTVPDGDTDAAPSEKSPVTESKEPSAAESEEMSLYTREACSEAVAGLVGSIEAGPAKEGEEPSASEESGSRPPDEVSSWGGEEPSKAGLETMAVKNDAPESVSEEEAEVTGDSAEDAGVEESASVDSDDMTAESLGITMTVPDVGLDEKSLTSTVVEEASVEVSSLDGVVSEGEELARASGTDEISGDGDDVSSPALSKERETIAEVLGLRMTAPDKGWAKSGAVEPLRGAEEPAADDDASNSDANGGD